MDISMMGTRETHRMRNPSDRRDGRGIEIPPCLLLGGVALGLLAGVDFTHFEFTQFGFQYYK